MAVKKFEINGKTYVAKDMTFLTVLELEDCGITLQNLTEKPMGCVNGYLAVCGNLTKEEAASEIQAHVIGGGNFSEITSIFAQKMEESDFFLAMQNQGVEEKTHQSEKKAPAKK